MWTTLRNIKSVMFHGSEVRIVSVESEHAAVYSVWNYIIFFSLKILPVMMINSFWNSLDGCWFSVLLMLQIGLLAMPTQRACTEGSGRGVPIVAGFESGFSIVNVVSQVWTMQQRWECTEDIARDVQVHADFTVTIPLWLMYSGFVQYTHPESVLKAVQEIYRWMLFLNVTTIVNVPSLSGTPTKRVSWRQ